MNDRHDFDHSDEVRGPMIVIVVGFTAVAALIIGVAIGSLLPW